MASGIIQKSRVSFNRYRISVYYFILYLFESIVDIFNTIRIFIRMETGVFLATLDL